MPLTCREVVELIRLQDFAALRQRDQLGEQKEGFLAFQVANSNQTGHHLSVTANSKKAKEKVD